MEPLSLALLREPMSIGAILFLLVSAGCMFAAARWLKDEESEE
jgi:hypothetical protein